MEKTKAIRVVSPTLPEEKVEEILEATHPFTYGKHLVYPSDSTGPRSHLPSFFYLKKWVSHPDAVPLVSYDLAGWLKRNGISFDLIFSPAEESVVKIVEELSEITGKPAAYLEYLPSGRFGEKIDPPDQFDSGTKVLVFNGVTVTGRCVGARLPAFVEKTGGIVAAISAFVKGTASGVKEAENKYGLRFYAGLQVDLPLYPPDPNECPLCLEEIPLVAWNEEDS